MKGGTTTKILLEVIFSLAHLLLRDHTIAKTVTMYDWHNIAMEMNKTVAIET